MKKGISLVSLTIVIVIMAILAGIVVVTGMDSFQTAELNTFAVEILNIQSAVDEYRFRYEKYPVGADRILNMSEIQNKFKNQFENEIIIDEEVSFKIVDLTLIGINDTEYGNNNYYNDVYVLSEATGRVYYLAGLEYEEQVYYTLTDKLYDISNISNNIQLTSRDIKVYDVIFTPSSKDITNQPITVLLKVPKQATIDNITTTNSKSVSEETVVGMYKQVEINTTSEDKTGNYKIIVNYTYNDIQKTAEYEVTNYDGAVPTVTYSEKTEGNLKTVTVTINDNGSKIKMVKYEQEIVADNSYFKNYGKIISNNQFVVNKDDYFTIYVETTSGVIVTVNNMLDEWKANVIDIVDGVPIPKGFVASSATGENKKDSGLVIYEGTEPVTDANVEDAKRSRNQYVWVPIAKEQFTTKFVRSNFGKTEKVITNTPGEVGKFWEIELDLKTNMPLEDQNETFISKAAAAEAQALYASVKKYEGFWVARYEAGGYTVDQTSSNAIIYSMMGKIPLSNLIWGDSYIDETGGVIELARNQYKAADSSYGVVSTLMYGVQWDSILQWWLDTKAVESVLDKTAFGNYKDRPILPEELNSGAKYYLDSTTGWQEVGTNSKDSETAWVLTTGALMPAKINNIYDMAGNRYEYTMEKIYDINEVKENAVVRGRSYSDTGDYNYVSIRGFDFINSRSYGARICLYIK